MNKSVFDSGQLPLSFHQYQDLSFQQFIVGDNVELLQMITAEVRGEERKPLYLWGQSGSGKSHLLQAACKQAHDTNKTVAYIPGELLLQHGADIFQGLEKLDIVCLDDLHLIVSHKSWQEAIFHLYNQMLENAHQLIMASRENPLASEIELADLKSRLSWGYIYHLKTLSDGDKQKLLIQRAAQRGFELPDAVAGFLLARVDRDLQSLLELLERIDHHSLAQHRKITIPFIKTLLSASD